MQEWTCWKCDIKYQLSLDRMMKDDIIITNFCAITKIKEEMS